MNEALLKRLWMVAAAVLAFPVLAALVWAPPTALGVFAGGAWNIVNLWCLTRLLAAWLGPQRSQRRVIGWLLVKFLVLYGLACGLLQHPAVSILGFSIGFSVILATAVAFLALRGRSMFAPAQPR